jgi:hypothetical protein
MLDLSLSARGLSLPAACRAVFTSCERALIPVARPRPRAAIQGPECGERLAPGAEAMSIFWHGVDGEGILKPFSCPRGKEQAR